MLKLRAAKEYQYWLRRWRAAAQAQSCWVAAAQACRLQLFAVRRLRQHAITSARYRWLLEAAAFRRRGLVAAIVLAALAVATGHARRRRALRGAAVRLLAGRSAARVLLRWKEFAAGAALLRRVLGRALERWEAVAAEVAEHGGEDAELFRLAKAALAGWRGRTSATAGRRRRRGAAAMAIAYRRAGLAAAVFAALAAVAGRTSRLRQYGLARRADKARRCLLGWGVVAGESRRGKRAGLLAAALRENEALLEASLAEDKADKALAALRQHRVQQQKQGKGQAPTQEWHEWQQEQQTAQIRSVRQESLQQENLRLQRELLRLQQQQSHPAANAMEASYRDRTAVGQRSQKLQAGQWSGRQQSAAIGSTAIGSGKVVRAAAAGDDLASGWGSVVVGIGDSEPGVVVGIGDSEPCEPTPTVGGGGGAGSKVSPPGWHSTELSTVSGGSQQPASAVRSSGASSGGEINCDRTFFPVDSLWRHLESEIRRLEQPGGGGGGGGTGLLGGGVDGGARRKELEAQMRRLNHQHQAEVDAQPAAPAEKKKVGVPEEEDEQLFIAGQLRRLRLLQAEVETSQVSQAATAEGSKGSPSAETEDRRAVLMRQLQDEIRRLELQGEASRLERLQRLDPAGLYINESVGPSDDADVARRKELEAEIRRLERVQGADQASGGFVGGESGADGGSARSEIRAALQEEIRRLELQSEISSLERLQRTGPAGLHSISESVGRAEADHALGDGSKQFGAGSATGGSGGGTRPLLGGTQPLDLKKEVRKLARELAGSVVTAASVGSHSSSEASGGVEGAGVVGDGEAAAGGGSGPAEWSLHSTVGARAALAASPPSAPPTPARDGGPGGGVGSIGNNQRPGLPAGPGGIVSSARAALAASPPTAPPTPAHLTYVDQRTIGRGGGGSNTRQQLGSGSAVPGSRDETTTDSGTDSDRWPSPLPPGARAPTAARHVNAIGGSGSSGIVTTQRVSEGHAVDGRRGEGGRGGRDRQAGARASSGAGRSRLGLEEEAEGWEMQWGFIPGADGGVRHGRLPLRPAWRAAGHLRRRRLLSRCWGHWCELTVLADFGRSYSDRYSDDGAASTSADEVRDAGRRVVAPHRGAEITRGAPDRPRSGEAAMLGVAGRATPGRRGAWRGAAPTHGGRGGRASPTSYGGGGVARRPAARSAAAAAVGPRGGSLAALAAVAATRPGSSVYRRTSPPPHYVLTGPPPAADDWTRAAASAPVEPPPLPSSALDPRAVSPVTVTIRRPTAGAMVRGRRAPDEWAECDSAGHSGFAEPGSSRWQQQPHQSPGRDWPHHLIPPESCLLHRRHCPTVAEAPKPAPRTISPGAEAGSARGGEVVYSRGGAGFERRAAADLAWQEQVAAMGFVPTRFKQF